MKDGLQITDMIIVESTGWLRLLTDSDHEGWCPGVPTSAAETIRTLYIHLCSSAPGPTSENGCGVPWSPRRPTRRQVSHYGRTSTSPCGICWVKSSSLPVHRVLGGFRDRVPASCRGGTELAADAAVEAAVTAATAGRWAYVDVVARSVEATLDVAPRIRQAVGPDFRLIHDGGGRYTHQEALRLGRGLEAATYHRFENPLPDTDVMGLEALCANLDLPVYTTISGPHAHRRAASLLARNATDGLIVSVPASGGITDVIKLARTAECFGVNCELGVDRTMGGYVHAQLLGAIRNAHFFASMDSGGDGSSASIEPLRPVDG